MPELRRPPTDADKRRFAKQGFATIRHLFEDSLTELASTDQSIETDFQPATEIDFRAEVFVNGKSKCRCRVWLGGMHSENNICYNSERYAPDNSCNEIISITDKQELSFTATMAMTMGYSQAKQAFNVNQMTDAEAANYLWQLFIQPLER